MKLNRSYKIVLLFAVLILLIFIAKSWFSSPEMPARLGNAYYLIAGLIAMLGFVYKLFKDQIDLRVSVFLKGQNKETLLQAIEDEKEYLNNLFSRLNGELPWEIKKFAELEALNSGIEPYGRKSKTRKKKSWLKGRSELMEEQLRSKVSIRAYLEREVVKGGALMLKGEPGSGKSMMARRFTADMAQKALNEKWSFEPLLPVFISLNAYNAVDTKGEPIAFFDFIRDHLKTEYQFADYIVNNLKKLLSKGRIILVLDGLNEMPADDNVKRIKNIEHFFGKDYPRIKCLITCRNIQFTSVDYKTLEINELSNEQIQKFIELYLGKEWVEPVFDQISASHGIAFKRFRNPFILRIYLQRDTRRSAPDSLAMLYSEYINDKFAQYEDEQFELLNKLKKISFCMSNEGLFAGYADIKTLSEKLNIDISEDFLKKCAKVNIIDHSLHGKFRFYHQIFQEYFSALVLDDLANNGENYEMYLKSPAWEEIVLVWGGIVEDLQILLKQVLEEKKDIRKLCLALKLCSVNSGKIDRQSVDDTIELTRTIFDGYEIIPKVEALKALAMLENEKSIDMIAYTLYTSTGWIRELCIQILGKSESEAAKAQLKLCMKDVKSFEAFFQARYFLPFNTWLSLYIRSQMRAEVLLPLLDRIWQFGFLFIPVLMVGLIYRGAVYTNLDPFVFVSRCNALILAIAVASLVRKNIKYLREDNIPLNFRSLKYIIGTTEIVLMVLIISSWFFGRETLETVLVLLFLGACYYLGWVIYLLLKNCRNIARFITVLIREGGFIGILTIVISAAFLFQVYGPAWTKDISFGSTPSEGKSIQSQVRFDSVSRFTNIMIDVNDVKTRHLAPVVIKIGGTIGVMSIIAYIITCFYYLRIIMRLRRYRQQGSQDDMETLVAMVTHPRLWPAIKKFILRRLRRQALPLLLINRLESYRDSEDDVMNELERTVYELKHTR
ncbi:NACHT domain-containing protein [Longitalea arenae]|uniref:NACHT domain-containing protein n=1 Tax=Longitalea arenae TaxID=2812558 RepID=UPI00196760CF|nr:NACHT domain-containing protein [Longitalea arenae]